MVIIRRRRIKIDFLGIVVGGRQQFRDANLMANTTIKSHFYLNGYRLRVRIQC